MQVLNTPREREACLTKVDDYLSGKMNYIQPDLLLEDVASHLSAMARWALKCEKKTADEIKNELSDAKKNYTNETIEARMQEYYDKATQIWAEISVMSSEFTDMKVQVRKRHLDYAIRCAQIYVQQEFFFAGPKNAIVYLQAALESAKENHVDVTHEEPIVSDLIGQLERRAHILA